MFNKWFMLVILIGSFNSCLSDCDPKYRKIGDWIYPTQFVGSFQKNNIPRDYTRWVNNKYYKYHAEKKDWYDAQQTCLSEGGNLAIPTSKEEAQILSRTIEDRAWIGVHKNLKLKNFITVLGDPLDKVIFEEWKWNFGAPDTRSERYQCIEMKIPLGQVVFDNSLCDHQRPFICEIPLCTYLPNQCDSSSVGDNSDKILAECEGTLQQQRIPVGHNKTIGNNYLKFYNEKKSWADAREFCLKLGGNLAVPNSGEKLKAIGGMINGPTWIGVHRYQKTNSWITVSGDLFPTALHEWRWRFQGPGRKNEFPFVCEFSPYKYSTKHSSLTPLTDTIYQN